MEVMTLWDKCLTALKNKTTPSQFAAYITGLQYDYVDGQHVIYAPNDIVYAHVKKHYWSEIEALIDAEGIGAVVFRVGTKRKAVNGASHVSNLLSSKNSSTPSNVTPINKRSILDEESSYVSPEFLADIKDYGIKNLSLSISAATYLPAHTVFMIGLSVWSSMACRKYCITYPDGKRLPIGLFVIAEQPSGTAKSRSTELFQRPFFNTHALAVKHYNEQLTEAAANETDKTEYKQLLKNPIPRFFITNGTPEAIEETLETNGGFFSLVSSEKGLLDALFGNAYLSGGQSNNNDLALNGYVGDYVSSLRIGRKGYTGYAVGAISAFVQDGAVQNLLNVSQGSGLAERFLLLCEPHSLGDRLHGINKAIDHELYKNYCMTAQALAESIIKNKTELNSLQTLEVNKSGWDIIDNLRNKIEPHLKDGGRYSNISIRGMASKIDMTILKIASNLFTLDNETTQQNLTSGALTFGSIELPDSYIKDACLIAQALLDATLALCEVKELTGKKASYIAIMRMFESSSSPLIQEKKLITSRRYVEPFKSMSGNKSEAVREALKQMVNDGVLMRDKDINGVVSYRIA